MKRNLLKLMLICVMSVFTLSASALRGGGTPDYLCFTAEEANSTVALNKNGTPTEVTLQTSTDGANWSDYTFGEEITLTSVGNKVYFRNADTSGTPTSFSIYSTNNYRFSMSGKIAASGNVMSLVDQTCETTTIPCGYCFYDLFNGCTSLTTAPELPATTLAERCYQSMFSGCSSLTSAPELPATILANYCYGYMFSSCSYLTSAPELPATTLASYCYYAMFTSCTRLTTAPKLPATTLASNCYHSMFTNCKGLTTAPKLPATTLASNCYHFMFYDCEGLTTAPELPATKLASDCYHSMFTNCKGLTTAPELPATTLAENCYSNMFEGCSSLTSAPELPATTLLKNCYRYMFNRCESLSDIKVAFSTFSTTYCSSWVASVASTGTFTCPSDLKTNSPGNSKNPSGWTVKNTFDLTVTSAGWASMCVNLPLKMPTTEGVEVYYASAVNGNSITLTQITGTTIPPRTAVLVKAVEGTVSFPVIKAAGTSFSSNLLKGTSVDKARNEAVYTLSGVGSNGNPQFQNYTGTTLGAHKAYLPASALPTAGATIEFVIDGATSIDLPTAAAKTTKVYNLNGQAVGSDYKGIVIVNGKKVLNK